MVGTDGPVEHILVNTPDYIKIATLVRLEGLYLDGFHKFL